ncbi:hypothetical protein GUJ93_ZPchr0008g12725 [Zizania palustris]|uniref:Uncharacterized protein n=1 Tax=Zizania palustris TaxID=103762 RepID=A0A8J5RPQ4_ZIZPA|nr:hypothetical protein GUJ93_ZPchr0008g12725 [Zizania palustris]
MTTFLNTSTSPLLFKNSNTSTSPSISCEINYLVVVWSYTILSCVLRKIIVIGVYSTCANKKTSLQHYFTSLAINFIFYIFMKYFYIVFCQNNSGAQWGPLSSFFKTLE